MQDVQHNSQGMTQKKEKEQQRDLINNQKVKKLDSIQTKNKREFRAEY